MKISLYSICLNCGYYGGPPMSLLEVIPLAKTWGYDGIELEAKRPHGSPLDLNADMRDRIKKSAADNGLPISCVAAYNDYSSPIDEHKENELLMTREQIRLAADLDSPFVRVFAQWSGVTRRDGAITYDIARHNMETRYPGHTPLERWCRVRECLVEASKMAADAGVILALQNHTPVTNNYRDVLSFVEEVNSPALKVCLDPPCMHRHTEEYYQQALRETGTLMVHSHYGGRFERDSDGKVVKLNPNPLGSDCDDASFYRNAKAIANFDGHTGYELCSPVLIGHRHADQEYAMEQCELAGQYMRQIVDSI